MINIDGVGEIDVIERHAKRRGGVQSVGIRVVASVGWSAQFGMGLRSGAAFAAARQILASPHLRLRGLHVHLGTGIAIANVGTYLQAIREVLEFGERLRRELGVTIEVYDFGGGFGVPTVRKFSRLDQPAPRAPTVAGVAATR